MSRKWALTLLGVLCIAALSFGTPANIASDLINMEAAPAGVADMKNIFKSEDGIIFAYGTTVPTDAAAGYAPGCIFFDVNASTRGTQVYQNEGTKASCNFDSLSNPVVGDLALTTGSVLVGAAGVAAELVAKTDTQILVGNGTTITSVAVSGDATLANTGALTIAADAVSNTKLANITRGSVKVGGTANAPTDLDAKTTGQILVGDGTDIVSVAVSGDATLAATGAVTLAFPIRSQASQTLLFSGFTDGGGTSGYIEFTTPLPAKALVLGWKAVVATGFTNDTTAIISVGVSGDTDKYSAVTNLSVFAAGTVASSVANDANVLEWAAATPRITVTGTADFTSINAGSMVVTIYYILLT